MERKIKLDVNLDKKERLELVNEYFKDYTPYHKHFDEKFNAHPKQSDGLSSDDKVCNELERIANYLLYDKDERKKDVKYNFYTKNKLEEKFKNVNPENVSYEDIIESLYVDSNEVDCLNFIVSSSNNYKKSKTQVINKSDINNKYIRDYEVFKNIVLAKLRMLRTLHINKPLQKKLVNMLIEVKTDQIICKDSINGTIYFKSPLQDSTRTDFDQFDFLDFKHVKELLSCSNNNVINDLGCLVSDLNDILDQIHLNDEEKEIIQFLRKNKTQCEIAVTMGFTTPYLNKIITSICNRVIKYYFKMYENWYYLNVSKGKYKKCSKCGEIKLANKSYFSKEKKVKDGFRAECKECEKISGK